MRALLVFLLQSRGARSLALRVASFLAALVSLPSRAFAAELRLPSVGQRLNALRSGALFLCLLITTAHAGDPAEADRLVAEGVALGESGDYRAAIERFAAAEQAFPRPIHDCNIGLAWIGLKQSATAFFFIERCQQRARKALPAWVAEQHATLRSALTADGFVAVQISSSPPGALLTIEGLEGAEPRTPATLLLPPKPVQIQAWLTGYALLETRYHARTAGPLALKLRRPPPVAPPSAAPPSVAVAPPSAAPVTVATTAAVPERSAVLGWTLVGTSVALAGVGGIFLSNAHGSADDAFAAAERGDEPARQAAFDDTRTSEGLAYGAFGLAAVALGVGLWDLLRDDPAAVSVIPLGTGLGLHVQLP